MAKANRVIHFDLQADNPERAKEFYEKTFGWEIKKWEGEGMEYWLIMTGSAGTPGIDGGLTVRPKEPEQQIHMYDFTVGVEDMDEILKNIKANGGQVLMDKMELKGVGWFARVGDTENNNFSIMQATGPMPE